MLRLILLVVALVLFVLAAVGVGHPRAQPDGGRARLLGGESARPAPVAMPRRTAADYTVCPACRRRLVVIVRHPDEDDEYVCVYRRGDDRCGWYAYAVPGNAACARWPVTNPRGP